ncbi:hypothetical protein GPX89_42050 [Nocardia sp. ET3-3]|uniref:RDD domain-containing protein n=1 Tax=Nocardia terrae TaxID=2675851 RepID=A0A7K1VBM8_9NOCA|nr:RDD family protein [Nocardia terrae]MVU83802.1 hypothetical protein [Nocardia terrae]
MNPPAPIDLSSGRFRPASIPARLLARTIDAVIVAIPVGALTTLIISESATDSAYSTPDSATGISSALLIAALAVAVSGPYEISCIAASGTTLGKRALGLRVVNAHTSSPPRDGTGTGTAFTRWANLTIPGLLTGGAWTLLCAASCTPGHRGWHDRAALTYVIADR